VRRRSALALLLLGTLAATSDPISRAQAQTQAAAPTPKLLVTLVVDQMRFDYIERYGSAWNAGLERLVTQGAVFERAMYPYLNTVTCAGHATIGTGAFPYRHGIILNEWYRRDAGRRMACTDDAQVKSVPYETPAEPIGHSARRLRVPTLGDRLREISPDSRIVTLSMKPRSAAMLAGHGGTAVTWLGDSNAWGTSTAYTTTPVAEVKAFIEANPIERERKVIWERVRDLRSYAGADAAKHERGRPGWTDTFPHPLAGEAGSSESRFFDLWERSPYSDAYLGRMAAALIRTMKLGQRDVVDYLAISFSALDYVGHDFGPESHEVQDTLFRLDQTIGELLSVLDAAVGRNRYVLGLSADHGVSRVPEALEAEGLEAGRVVNAQVLKAAEAAMVAAHGAGPHVTHVEYTNVYLAPAARTRAANDPSFVAPIIAAVTKVPGVERAFPSASLAQKRNSTDPIERAAALSYHPDESGEVVVVLKPNWIGTNTSAATHGSARWYDQHVPVIFMGAGIKAGRYTTSASPADLAPTLASTIQLTLSNIDGQVLRDAVR
jgi:predicted AlkP superfamily pyrophosphatase or phosphodiesterase